MSEQHVPPMAISEALKLGSIIDYSDYRSACREIHRRRIMQAKRSAHAEAHYQKVKAKALFRLIHGDPENPDAPTFSATEAKERVKGEDEVATAAIERDLQAELLEVIKEDGWNLRTLADWSQHVGDPSYGQTFTGPQGVAA
jgi:hypothetical protein